ncbi:MAG: replication initiator protein A, partial [Albidovulum sp.]|nr:replication initiator protein A [Albidovulum sp.]
MAEKPIRPMLPVRHAPNLFSIDIGSISLKDVQQQMEFPFFSLAKNPDLEPRRYEDRHGNTLEITAHSTGLPTIYDKDFLIYAVSQIMERLNRGERASRRLILYASDMLEFANRTKGGKDYKTVEDALLRLSGCRIRTNIRTGDIYQTSIFGLIESGDLIRKYGFDGRLQHVEITLSEWLWRAIEARQVLTLHPDYFRLRQPLERRIYEIARKFCGRQAEWQISLVLLQQKCGSRSKLFEFRRSVRKLAAKGDLLDYVVAFDAGRDAVAFRRQEGSLVDRIPAADGDGGIELPDSVAAEARRRHGGGIDLAAAERAWRGWMARKGVRPTNPPALFLSFLAT